MDGGVNVQSEREIKANELTYTKQVLVLKRIELHAYVLIGAVFLAMAGMLIPVLLFGVSRASILTVLLLGVPLVGLCFYVGRGIGRQGHKKKAVLDDKVCSLKGPVTYVTHHVGNAKGEEFFIGDITLRLPPATSLVIFVANEQNGYRETELDVVFIETSSKQTPDSESSVTKKEAIVVYLEDYIDIDTALTRHGQHYFIRECLSIFGVTVFCLAIGFLGFLYAFPKERLLETNPLLLLLAALTDIAIVALGCYLIKKLYVTVRQCINPYYKPSTYCERLSGKR
ncbi:hypothetical protein EVC62_08345 [Salinicola endophyticus]|uniref:Uncharacterized protein n=1 Tax=Salinicola endophyticus TaxID=1949083 RepID=A0ABY8FIR8_9GAMM|nr:hypothetical protein [Salinicola endophyticus]WFF41513.1 hypothetical protein EVC62_08345 [Salinicola endophyticus]